VFRWNWVKLQNQIARSESQLSIKLISLISQPSCATEGHAQNFRLGPRLPFFGLRLRWKIQSARAEKRNQMIKSTNEGKLLGPQLAGAGLLGCTVCGKSKLKPRKQKVAMAANELVSTEVFLKTLVNFSAGTSPFFLVFFVTTAEGILNR